MLTETEIADEAKQCEGGMGGPVVRWRDFYKRSLRSQFIRKDSQCVVTGEMNASIITNKTEALCKALL